jgi:predicted MFS family arabinose efflux permease
VFSVFIQFADSAKYLSTNLISAVGWKNSWYIFGGLGILCGVLLIFTTPNVGQKQLTNERKKTIKRTLKKMRTQQINEEKM